MMEPLRLQSLKLIRSNAELKETHLTKDGGFIRLNIEGANAKPEFLENGCQIASSIALQVQGVRGEEDQEEDQEEIFSMDIAYEAVFLVSSEEGDRFGGDSEFEDELSMRFANFIFPSLRSHARELLLKMELPQFHLSWSLLREQQ